MNRAEPQCWSGVLSGVCACVGLVKGTACSLCCSMGPAMCLCACVPSGSMYPAALPLAGPGDSLLWLPCIHGDRSDPGGIPMGAKAAFGYLSSQLQSTACNRTISCLGELHRSGTHCWLLFFLICSPPTVFDSLRFKSQQRQSELAPTSSLCASRESSCKQYSEKVIEVWRDHHQTEPSESHHLLSAANCNYSSGCGTDGHGFLLKTPPFGKLVELL